MRRFLGPILALPALAAVLGEIGDSSAADSARVPSFADELRYLGRDAHTGLPTQIGERFIAEAELAIERYGQDPTTPVPPPPAEGVDIVSLAIPALGIAPAPVARLGLDAYRRLDVPQDTETVGWNPAYARLPGTGGSTFFAAHFEYGGLPGVFFRLATLPAGSEVGVALSDGSLHRYRVVSVVDYPLAAIDMGALLMGLEGRESIVLMTCSGPPEEGNYPYRTVVLAERVE